MKNFYPSKTITMRNNLVYQTLKLELSKENKGTSIDDISFIKTVDENRISINLDISGFDDDLVEKHLEELENLKEWKSIDDGKILSGFISCSSILVDEMKIAFLMLKKDFKNFLEVEELKIIA